MADSVEAVVAYFYRSHYSALVAPLIRIMGSFEEAEDVVQDTFTKAIVTWKRQGIPEKPIAWLRTSAKNRAIDHYRRSKRWQHKSSLLSEEKLEIFSLHDGSDDVRDDTLRLIFTCCHPSLAPTAQIALTLRIVCGFTTEEAARSMLVLPATLQQRIVRAKRKIDIANIPYIVPNVESLPSRLATALHTIYLVFNEGYGATTGDELIRGELCEEAIRLARILGEYLPAQVAPKALLALMLLQHSRHNTRLDPQGRIITLDRQDRTKWDHNAIAEALPLVEQGLRAKPIPNYALEAAIAALHAQAKTAEATDWSQISALYLLLLARSNGNPVVALNAAVARAMAGDLEGGLAQLDVLSSDNALPNYHLLPAARADLLVRLERWQEAQAAFIDALALVGNDVERCFMEGRLAETNQALQK